MLKSRKCKIIYEKSRRIANNGVKTSSGRGKTRNRVRIREGGSPEEDNSAQNGVSQGRAGIRSERIRDNRRISRRKENSSHSGDVKKRELQDPLPVTQRPRHAVVQGERQIRAHSADRGGGTTERTPLNFDRAMMIGG